MNIDIKIIEHEINNIIPKIKDIRHHIHAHPELSLDEHNTSAYIREQLKSLNIGDFTSIFINRCHCFIKS